MTTKALQDMTTQELLDMIAAQKTVIASARNTSARPQLMVKENSKGGMFLCDQRITEVSAKTGKSYSPSLNVHTYQLGIFHHILKNDEVRKIVLKYLDDGTPFAA